MHTFAKSSNQVCWDASKILGLFTPPICEETNYCPDLTEHILPVGMSGTAGSHSEQWKVPFCASWSSSLFSVSCSFLFRCERKRARQQCQLSGFDVAGCDVAQLFTANLKMIDAFWRIQPLTLS